MNIFLIIVFILGLCLGSFANVLIDRTHNNKKITGRSRCDFCNYKLRWFDNIPVLSFVFLGGNCRKCGKKLSWQYPAVEFLTGTLFFLTAGLFFEKNSFGLFAGFGDCIGFFYYIAIFYILWIVLIWDLKYMIIPDFLIVFGLIITGFYLLFESFIFKCWASGINCPLVSGVLGGLLIGGFFLILFFISKGRWIGGGDVKLGFLIGLIIGFKMVYFFFLIAYTSGAIASIFLMFFSGKKMNSEIPFGPFLIFSAYLIIFKNEFILEIWNSFLV